MPRHPYPNDFEPIKRLGQGSFGKVFLVKKKCGTDRNRLYAMKITKISKIMSTKGREHYNNKCYIHQNVTDSPFLVGMYYSFETKSKISLMLDYYPGGDLADFLDERGPLSESDAQLYLAKIVLGVQHLHELGTIHHDLKPENILLSADGHIAISDNGIPKIFLSNREKQSYVLHLRDPTIYGPRGDRGCRPRHGSGLVGCWSYRLLNVDWHQTL
jgi:p90 ribosomal S6 kinase